MEIIWTNFEFKKKFVASNISKNFTKNKKKGQNSLFDVYVKF